MAAIAVSCCSKSMTSSATQDERPGDRQPERLGGLEVMTSSNLVGCYNNKDSEVPTAAKPDF
jgi:hypothetical protein